MELTSRELEIVYGIVFSFAPRALDSLDLIKSPFHRILNGHKIRQMRKRQEVEDLFIGYREISGCNLASTGCQICFCDRRNCETDLYSSGYAM